MLVAAHFAALPEDNDAGVLEILALPAGNATRARLEEILNLMPNNPL